MKRNLIELLTQEKIYPIIRLSDAQKATDIAKALIDAGIKVLEITIENPTLYSVIEELSKEALICAGGIITAQQADEAFTHKASLFSSPIFQMNLVKISKNKQIPFIAGASTANEAYDAWKARVPLIKIFPATALGGVQYIEDLLRPMPFLNIMPMGNIHIDTIPSYINAGAIAVGVGRNLYEGLSFSEITKRTKELKASLEG